MPPKLIYSPVFGTNIPIPKRPALPKLTGNVHKVRERYMSRPEIDDPNTPGNMIDNAATSLGATPGFPADKAWRWLAKQAFTGKNAYENE